MKIKMKVAMMVNQPEGMLDLAAGDSAEVDDATGASLVNAGVATRVGKSSKAAPEAPKGVTTEDVISSD